MSKTNIFELATREQIRFNSNSGQLGVEQLWALPLTSNTKINLNDVAKEVSRELKQLGEESFVSTVSDKHQSVRTTLELKLEIVKHIIAVRQEENSARVDEQNRQAKARHLDQLIQQKQDDKLNNLTLEELQTMRQAL